MTVDKIIILTVHNTLPGCQEHGFIKDVSDEQLSATSSEAHYGPQTSRLQPGFSTPSTPGDAFGSGGWQAQFTRADQYIQVRTVTLFSHSSGAV